MRPKLFDHFKEEEGGDGGGREAGASLLKIWCLWWRWLEGISRHWGWERWSPRKREIFSWKFPACPSEINYHVQTVSRGSILFWSCVIQYPSEEEADDFDCPMRRWWCSVLSEEFTQVGDFHGPDWWLIELIKTSWGFLCSVQSMANLVNSGRVLSLLPTDPREPPPNCRCRSYRGITK